MKILTQIQALTTTQVNALKINDATTTYYSGEDIIDIISMLYGDYICHDFYNSFKLWLKLNKDNFIKVCQALQKDYDITENYDRYSEITSDLARTTTTTEITSPAVTNETQTATYDSAEYKNHNKNTTSVTGENKTETSIDFDTTETKGHNTITQEHTHGNIGVTTVAQMIDGEYKTRSRDYLIQFLNRFINIFAYCVWSD